MPHPFAILAVNAVPFVVYYLIVVLRFRGWRDSSSLVLTAVGLSVVLTPLVTDISLSLLPLSESTSRHVALGTCVMLPSILLAIALWFDCRTIPAAFAPLVAAGVAAAFSVAFGDTKSLWLELTFPAAIWHLAVVIGLLLFARPAWKLQSIGPGLCPSCGYSTQGLAEGSPCPECGTLHPQKIA